MKRIVLLVGLLLALGTEGAPPEPGLGDELLRRAAGVDRCLLGPKGGVGVVATGVHVLTSSDENTILLPSSKVWKGKGFAHVR